MILALIFCLVSSVASIVFQIEVFQIVVFQIEVFQIEVFQNRSVSK